jgi:hypothetical protein
MNLGIHHAPQEVFARGAFEVLTKLGHHGQEFGGHFVEIPGDLHGCVIRPFSAGLVPCQQPDSLRVLFLLVGEALEDLLLRGLPGVANGQPDVDGAHQVLDLLRRLEALLGRHGVASKACAS